MRIFVTGGTGLFGNNLLRQLTEAGHDLIALVRQQPDPQVFEGIKTDFAVGDLSDRDCLLTAIHGCDAVIHSAGLIHLGWTKLEESMQVNRDGTRAIVDACCKHSVPLVHVGTVNALAVGARKTLANEETPLEHAGGQVPCTYVASKRAGVDEVLSAVSRKLRTVIVHPGLMLGPWDWKPSSGRMITEICAAWRPITPSGGGSICDSRDVATGAIAAMHKLVKGELESGRQFILAGENWTYFELWKQITKQAGARKPLMPAGPAQRWIGGWVGDLMTRIRENETHLNSASVRMSSQYHWYDCSRARKELGYRSRDPVDSIRDAVQWLQAYGKLAD